MLKLGATEEIIVEISKNTINKILEQQSIPGHLFDMHELQKVSNQTKEEIKKLIDADKESGWDLEDPDQDEENEEEEE